MKDEIVKCEITGITDYGIFVKLENDYTGLIHISEISDKFVNNIGDTYLLGDVIEAKVIEVDDEKKQVKLSIKKGNKKRQDFLQEKGHGFEPLKDNLDTWVQEKLDELSKL